MTSDGIAIDFRKLILEERKRAKKEKQQPKNTCKHEQNDQHTTPQTRHEEEYSQQVDSDWRLPRDLIPSFDPAQHVLSNNKPKSIYHVSNFLPQDYSNRLIPWLQSLPCSETKAEDPNGKWTTLKYGKRRVAIFDSTQQQIPIPLQNVIQVLVERGIFDATHVPNHVLVNEYTVSQGIMPHTDGPLYHDTTATISIGGGDVLLNFTPRRQTNRNDNTSCCLQVWLEGCGSLVVFTRDAYTNYCHGIHDGITEEYASDPCVNASSGTLIKRGYRISLTFRHKYPQS